MNGQPRTQKEIVDEIIEKQKEQINKNEYTIVDNSKTKEIEKSQLIAKEKEQRQLKEIVKENKKQNEQQDIKLIKIKQDYSTKLEKFLSEKFVKNNEGIFEVTNRIPTKLLIKLILPYIANIDEKKLFVNENNNKVLEQMKEQKGIYLLKVNGNNIKIKFV